jgi:thiol-disulfide isomerase/thioredoxin
VVINVWASWCAPCRKEAPQLVDFNLKNPNVKMLGINTRDNEPAARAFEKYFKVEYPSLIDPDGSFQLAFRDSLPLSAIPTTVILDRSGRPSARILGETTRSLLESVIAEIEKD